MSYSGFNVRGFRSTSGWEDSMWGGYSKVLWDHPEIKMDGKLEWEGKTGKLSWYCYNQLIKLFLLNAKQQGSGEYLYQDMEKDKITKWFQKFTRYTFNSNHVNKVLNNLISSEIELANMFKHYKDLISNTTFYYDVPEKQEGKGNDGKSGEGDGEGNSGEGDSGNDGDGDNKDGKGQSIEERLQKVFASIREKKVEENYGNWYGGWGGHSEQDPVFKIMPVKTRCEYTGEEILYASQLVNLLDITFDPSIDRIGALKSGKLDVAKICEIPSGNFNVYYRHEENISTKPFSVCVLIDESGSMDSIIDKGSKLWYAASMMKVLYKAFSEIIPQDKMFFYGHSGNSIPIISVYHDKYNQNFEESVGYVGRYQDNNYDGPVINSIYEKIRGYTNDNIIFIVVSDGQPCSWGDVNPVTDMKRIIERCKRDGFVTLGVGVQFDGPKHIYPYHTIVYNMQNDFVKKVSLLINHVVKTEFQN